jgi:PRC-barrel domain
MMAIAAQPAVPALAAADPASTDPAAGRPAPGAANAGTVAMTRQCMTSDGRIRFGTLVGASVGNDQDRPVGSVDDVLIGTDHKAAVAVLRGGTFLGMGSKLLTVRSTESACRHGRDRGCDRGILDAFVCLDVRRLTTTLASGGGDRRWPTPGYASSTPPSGPGCGLPYWFKDSHATRRLSVHLSGNVHGRGRLSHKTT